MLAHSVVQVGIYGFHGGIHRPIIARSIGWTASTWTANSTPPVVQQRIYGFGAKKLLDSLNMDRNSAHPVQQRAVADGGPVDATTGAEQRSHRCQDWRLLSKIFIFLALDEALQIHEILIIPGLRHQVHPALASTWVVPYAVLALILLWRFRRFLGSISRATASRLLRSGAVYIGGAIGMEMIGSFAVRSNLIRLHSPWYGAITGLEEALELVGIILLIDALLRALLDQRNSLDLTLRLGPDSDSN